MEEVKVKKPRKPYKLRLVDGPVGHLLPFEAAPAYKRQCKGEANMVSRHYPEAIAQLTIAAAPIARKHLA